MSGETVIAHWLIPTEPAYSSFQRIINELACRYDGPVFEPHVTIHVGTDRDDSRTHAIIHALRGCKRIILNLIGIDHSERFTKTLFVEFAMTAELRRINELILKTARDSSQYELKPHLSLLYKKLSAETRRNLATVTKIAVREVTFGTIKAMRCVSLTQSRADVEAWRVIETLSLCGR